MNCNEVKNKQFNNWYVNLNNCYVNLNNCYVHLNNCYVNLNNCYVYLSNCYVNLNNCYVNFKYLSCFEPVRPQQQYCQLACPFIQINKIFRVNMHVSIVLFLIYNAN